MDTVLCTLGERPPNLMVIEIKKAYLFSYKLPFNILEWIKPTKFNKDLQENPKMASWILHRCMAMLDLFSKTQSPWFFPFMLCLMTFTRLSGRSMPSLARQGILTVQASTCFHWFWLMQNPPCRKYGRGTPPFKNTSIFSLSSLIQKMWIFFFFLGVGRGHRQRERL